MAHTDELPPGPDLSQGVALASIPASGVLAGRVGSDAVLIARLDDGLHAVDGRCTHYGGPLGEGLVVGDEVRCPWHHACFSLRTGRARKAPAFGTLATWKVEVVGDQVFVREKTKMAKPAPTPRTTREHVVIIGGGAAGFAAAERLRELGHAGTLTMLSADSDAPYDRPNLSKDYLAGTAPEEWIPLSSAKHYANRKIDVRTASKVVAIHPDAREVELREGDRIPYDALLLATGAAPRPLRLPGFDASNVFMLRSLADARAIIAACANAKSVALIGAGFIGMEAAGALRQRGLDVHVVAPDAVPLERALGKEVGAFVQSLHAKKGVQFHLGQKPASFDGNTLALESGDRIDVVFVLVGTGVAPRTSLAEAAGLNVDEGIVVDKFLQTSAPGIFAAGDVARFPIGDGHAGVEHARIEHWVHAERMGQAAAANILGAQHAFDDVPYFWTHHQGVEVRYCGYAGKWDDVRIDGDLQGQDFTARYYRGGKLVAAASVGRDLENLEIEESLRDRER
ncbi:FAD-dependent oxidoreductase [Lysobacter sp. A6]|uniref:FAD-dependent oxidoreductase n=1 Tax=Noviluteimonas lactosilytica TaxID=2888523 RepID=A0ABS8JHU3_9GAMM|nr:FAD-dependent oxidoreductase [Lysobacter lactosilyticus]MCC8363142.1 FAD-dependent oxidoreductase [Lysobacter lactosilyticus]